MVALLWVTWAAMCVHGMNVPAHKSTTTCASHRISNRVVPFIDNLHAKARSAIRDRRYRVASEIYKTILYQLPEHVDVPAKLLEDTYLLMALHKQREKQVEQARMMFGEGLKRIRNSPKLLTALALMESKEGRMRTARCIVQLVKNWDPQRGEPLSKWKMFEKEIEKAHSNHE